MLSGWVAGLLLVAGRPYSSLAGLVVLVSLYWARRLDPLPAVAWAAPVLGGAVAFSSYYEAVGPSGEGHGWLVYILGSLVGLAGFMVAEVSYLAKALDYGVDLGMVRVSVAAAYYYLRWILLALGFMLSYFVDVVAPMYLMGGLVGVAEFYVVHTGEAGKL